MEWKKKLISYPQLDFKLLEVTNEVLEMMVHDFDHRIHDH